MMRTVFGKRGAVRAACLIAGIVCTVCPLRVHAAEENGIPRPSSAKIYSSMSDDSDIIANLIAGNIFEVTRAENDGNGIIWYRVKADFGVEGYVKAGELDRLIMDAQALQLPAVTDTADGQAGEEPAPEGDETGDEPDGEAAEDENAGEEAAPEDENAAESASAFTDGAGFGEAADGQTVDSAIIGSEGFTVIERTDKTEVHRHGGIDAMLIVIAAGGILCITAIAVLVKRIRTCLRTEG